MRDQFIKFEIYKSLRIRGHGSAGGMKLHI